MDFTNATLKYLERHINTVPGTTMNAWCPRTLEHIVILVLEQFAFDIANSLDTGKPVDFDSMYRQDLEYEPEPIPLYISYGAAVGTMRDYMDHYGVAFYFPKITSKQRNDVHVYVNKLVNFICRRAMDRLANELEENPDYPKIIDTYNLEAEHFYMIRPIIFPNWKSGTFGMVDFSSPILQIVKRLMVEISPGGPAIPVDMMSIRALQEIIDMNITQLGYDIADKLDKEQHVPKFNQLINKVVITYMYEAIPEQSIRTSLEDVLSTLGYEDYEINDEDSDFLHKYINQLVSVIAEAAIYSLLDNNPDGHIASTKVLDYLNIYAAYYVELARVYAFPADRDINADLNRGIDERPYDDDLFWDEEEYDAGVYVKPRIRLYWKP